jgi:DNA-binding NtrC family response regulator
LREPARGDMIRRHMPTLLIVDDEANIRSSLASALGRDGYQVDGAASPAEARGRLREAYDFVLLDVMFPEGSGLDLLGEIMSAAPETVVIMMSGHATIDDAVKATRLGAFDFLEKPVGLQKLLGTVARALKVSLAREPRRVSLATIGTSAAMRDVERQMEQLLAARKPLLILGEPGAGHDVAARALHATDAPRVALPSGARLATNPLAVLEEARDGTLYCAEIGQYGKAEQRGLAFLLPKLDKANVTLVCTSTEPLGNMAAENKFDAALLAALSTGAVLLPPLRARREDIPALIERFWHDVVAQERSAQHPAARTFATLQPTALNLLSGAFWPGNLDHLQSVVANLALYAGSGDLTTEHVKRLLGEAAAANQAVAPEITARFFELPLREAREAFERIYFEQLLGREQSNMSRVAERAGLERTHLYRKLKQLSIRFARRGDDGNGGG